MVATKTESVIVSANISSGGSNSPTFTALTGYGATLMASVTNVSAMTVGCTMTVETAADGSGLRTFRWCRVTTGTAIGVWPMQVELPAEIQYARVTFTGHTGATIVGRAVLVEMTS